MAKLKSKEIKDMGKGELDSKIIEIKKELIKLNAQIATGTIPKSPGEVKNLKKNIARLLTKKNMGGRT
ncbi:MAG: 50S ribosomal protein L29 [Candidatus Woesearchaeota archaeon]